MVSQRDHKIINMLFDMAQTSDLNHKLASALYRNGKVYTAAVNVKRSTYKRKHTYSTHSEINAIYNYNKNFKDIHKCTLYIVRYSKSGIGSSIPCIHCLNNIKKYKIKKVIYINDNREIVCSKPEHIKKQHISSANKTNKKIIDFYI